jgi:hypothetical protein
MGARKYYFEIYRQFGQALSKFSPALLWTHMGCASKISFVKVSCDGVEWLQLAKDVK